MLPLVGSTATPWGECRFAVPNDVMYAPVSASSSTIRLLPESATYATPAATVTSYGFLSAMPLAVLTDHVAGGPDVGRLSTLLANVSATMRWPATPASTA